MASGHRVLEPLAKYIFTLLELLDFLLQVVASVPEYDVVVAISALEDPPVRARDGSPVLGERRRRPSAVGERDDGVELTTLDWLSSSPCAGLHQPTS